MSTRNIGCITRGDYQTLVGAVPQLKRGQVWCKTCGSTRKVDSARCLTVGWPKCCNQTMTIDSPEEQKQ